jgi:hypothetical protein
MKPVDVGGDSSAPTDGLNGSEFRALVIDTLDREPDAAFERVHARLRSQRGRALDDAEIEGLRDAYQAELAQPTGAHRVGAVEQAQIEAKGPFALRRTEMGGAVAGVIPFFVHLQTITPAAVTRTGEVVPAGVYDFVAMLGGFIALLLGASAVRQGIQSVVRRPLHLALGGLVVLLGAYQSLLGLGLLHKIGLFQAG